MNKGYLAALSAYLFWGLTPIYWKIVASVPAFEILGLRIFWAVPFVLILLWIKNDFTGLKAVRTAPRKYKAYLLSPFLLATNWYVWIWAVSNNFVVDASLGYFINPLLNVFLGFVFLHEKLRRFQWISLFLALAGVFYLTVNYGHFPWIAMVLAVSFALYGFIRKTAKLGALNGLSIEMLVLILPAAAVLLFLYGNRTFTLPELNIEMHLWLSLTGIITVFPLMVFAYAARRIQYSTLGFIQYVAPTLHFILGVFLYNEDFSFDKLIGFCFIWLALIIYFFENFIFIRRRIISTADK